MSDLELLLEKVRTAEAGSRELDLHLHARVAQRGEWADGDIRYALTDIEGTTAPPHYTTSIDAIVALIEREMPRCFWDATKHVGLAKRKRKADKVVTPYEAYVATSDRIGEPGYVFALSDPYPSAALALCAAFLAARIQTGSGETGNE